MAACFRGDIIPAVVLPALGTLFSLVAGFLVHSSTMPPVWRWLHVIAYEPWLFSALMVRKI